MGERLPCKQEVTSSNLVISTKAFLKAQTMERHGEQVYLQLPGRGICKMPVNEKIEDFRVARELEKAFHNMYLENYILKMIRHQTV